MKKSALLHPKPILDTPFTGRRIVGYLEKRAQEIFELAADLPEPPVSIVIRTRNNQQYIKGLLEDIGQQVYDAPIEIIIVDTESSDNTLEIAKEYGVRIISIKQQDFTYPKALNLGFEAARRPYVMSLVGHSNLSNRYTLKALAYWASQEKFGGMFCGPLNNFNASRTERIALGMGLAQRYRTAKLEKPGATTMGILGANGAIVKKSVLEKLGRFNEAYAGGGEDAALGQKMLAEGYKVVREPLCAVLHSHGLSFGDCVRQLHHWMSVGKPTPFVQTKILKRRPDLRT